jgi:glycopeptide antibiotics resistance protein
MATDRMTSGRASVYGFLWYTLSGLWLSIYLVLTLISGLRHPISPVSRILLLLLSCLCAYLGARLPRPGERLAASVRQRRVRRVMWFCFFLYLHLVLTFTLFDPGMGRNFFYFLHATSEDRAYYMQWHINLVPLHTIRTVYLDGYRNGYITEGSLLLNLAGNLLVFAPFAFFVPYLWRGRHPFIRFFLVTSAAVLAVELCQLALMCGACDVDDVILNLSGALITYLLLRLPPVRALVARATAQPSV